MFGFGKKKIELENIKTFNGALKAISNFIYLKEWESAHAAIEEIKEKEALAFEHLEEKLKNNYTESEKQRRIYEKNKKLIQKLASKYEVEKIKYDRKLEEDKFQIRFKKVRVELVKLTAT